MAKTLIFTFCLFGNFLFQTPLYAQNTVVATATLVIGKVTAINEEGQSRDLKKKDELYLNDQIETGYSSFLKIKLIDKTEFTLGAKSSLKLDEVTIGAQKEIIRATLEGVFRFKTEEKAKQIAKDMQITTPVAVIAVRGTQVAGEASKRKALIILEPEEGKKSAHVVVSSQVKGQTQEAHLREFGTGTRVKRGKAPSTPEKISEGERKRLQKKLTPPDENGGGLASFDAIDQLGTGSQGGSSPDARDLIVGGEQESSSNSSDSYSNDSYSH